MVTFKNREKTRKIQGKNCERKLRITATLCASKAQSKAGRLPHDYRHIDASVYQVSTVVAF